MARFYITAVVDFPEEVQALDGWLAKWRDKVDYILEDEGCGCCVNCYEVEGPQEALNDLLGLPLSVSYYGE